jgi:hypothetical protein
VVAVLSVLPALLPAPAAHASTVDTGAPRPGVPLPTVSQLPLTAISHPFGGATWQAVPEDLAALGYVEGE